MKLVKQILVLMGILAANSTLNAESQISNNLPTRAIVLMADLKTSQALQQYILAHENVVVLFYGETCPPCKRFEPVFTALADGPEFANTVTFIKVSATQYASVRKLYGVTKWPTVIYFKHGREIRRDVRRDDLSFISADTFRQHVVDLVALLS